MNHQFLLESLSDYPTEDEYYSLLAALGIGSYKSFYVQMLSWFAHFFRSFYSLHTFSFVTSHILLCIGFFWYHFRRSITLGTNVFFTGMLGISSMNIVLSRKMHFWGVAFFFLIMASSTYLEGKFRKCFLCCALFALGFFRVEFFFSAIAAFLILFSPKSKKELIVFAMAALVIFALVLVLIMQHFMGAEELFKQAVFYNNLNDGGLLLRPFQNFYVYFYRSFYAFFSNLHPYFINMVNAFIVVVLMVNPIRENLKHMYKTYKADFLFYLFPACFAFLVIRHYYLYTIIFYVLTLSFLAFLLNSKKAVWVSYLLSVLVISTFLLTTPKFSGYMNTNFWSERQMLGQMNRTFHHLVRSLPKDPHGKAFRILSYSRLDGVIPGKEYEFFLHRDLKEVCKDQHLYFDMVLVVGEFETDESKQCVLKALNEYQEIKLSEFGKVYFSDRIDAAEMDANIKQWH